MHLLYRDREKNSAGFRSCYTGLMQTYLHSFTGDCKSSGVIIVIKSTVSQNKETDYLPLLLRTTRDFRLPASRPLLLRLL